MRVICTLCEKIFSKQSNLNAHRKNVHKENFKNIIFYAYETYNHKCLEGCDASFRLISDLRCHLEFDHNIEMNVECLLFPTYSEFNCWLEYMSYRERVQYIKCNNNLKSKKSCYFVCNRSGKVCSKVTERKRALKGKGSCKLNFSCISQIILKENESGFEVIYHKTHYGHKIQLEHIRINKLERKSIAAKLTSGKTVQRILNDIHENIHDDNSKRIDYLTKKDIRNIRQAFNSKEPEGMYAYILSPYKLICERKSDSCEMNTDDDYEVLGSSQVFPDEGRIEEIEEIDETEGILKDRVSNIPNVITNESDTPTNINSHDKISQHLKDALFIINDYRDETMVDSFTTE